MTTLFLLLFLMIPAMLSADNVSKEEAQTIAEQFFASKSTRSNYAPSLRMIWDGETVITRTETAPAFYVFNNESDGGFVIVSGDNNTVSPILGYSFEHKFNAENMPENLRNWMSGLRKEINEERANKVTLSSKSNWANYEYNDKQPIKLLETALWDQMSPYNSKLPLGYVTGCPATAISIVMRYHKWPEKGIGTIPSSNENIGDIKLGHTYDWDNMPLDYTGATEEQNEQVGILMRDVGALIRTQYGQGTAGAKPEETLPQLLPIYMRYNKSTIKSIFKKDFSEEEWHSIMQKEIDEERPILYGGYSSGGGHQFVIDGYAADNYYHVNWGWSGVSNGYYLLSSMNPPQQGTGGSSSADGFTKKQDAIIGIQPDPNNAGGGFYDLISYKPYHNNDPYGISTTATSFEEDVEFTVDMKEFQNKGTRPFTGKVAIAHFSADGFITDIISKEISYNVYPIDINEYTETSLKCTINYPIEPGDYICGVFKHENPSEWTPIHNGYLSNDNCTEKIVMKEATAPVSYDMTITVGKGGKVICGNQEISDGTSVIKATEGSNVNIFILSEEGFKTHSVLYNGIEVISEVKDNTYTTPAITSASTLNVTFEDVSGINDATTNQLKVYASEGFIVVEGLNIADNISIYTADGAIVKSIEVTSPIMRISLPEGRTYITRIGERTFKTIL